LAGVLHHIEQRSNMAFLEKIEISGFRSIREAVLELRPVNVLIGANGAGKSNLVSFFQMLNTSLRGENGLQDFVIRQGGASRLMHFGAKRTEFIAGRSRFRTPGGIVGHQFDLIHIGEDSLAYINEQINFQSNDATQPESMTKRGHRQSFLSKPLKNQTNLDKAQQAVQSFLDDCRVYHFNDTTPESPLRKRSGLDESTYLRADGGNLPAYLFYLRENFTDSYRRIVQTLQQLLPWFEGFYLEPEKDSLVLRCHAAGHSEYPLTVGQISDGSLRLMALVTLLRQPAERRPQLIILDEPELGLHPAAEATIARLIQSVAIESGQVLAATQSASFLNNFKADEVVVVANEGGESKFIRHTEEELAVWLRRYTLAEIWRKNLIGGRP
jgi:predicted ATPase